MATANRVKEEIKQEINRCQEVKARWEEGVLRYEKTIDGYKKDLQHPSTSVNGRKELQERVQYYENVIKSYKSHISSCNADILQHQDAMLTALQSEEKERHREAYRKAIMEKKTLRMRAVRVINVGLPRSGKTAFQRRMRGEIFNIMRAIERGEKVQPSTGVAEAGGQVFIRKKKKTAAGVGAISGKVWSVLPDLKKEAAMLGQLLYQTVYGSPSSDTSVENADSPTSANESANSSEQKNLKDSLPSRNSPSSSSAEMPSSSSAGAEAEETDSLVAPTEEQLDEMFGVIQEAMEAEDWDKMKFLLDDLILLINTDTGGQAEFMDLQAALVQGPSLNLLFSRLVDNLYSQFEIYYTDHEGVSTEKEDSIMTVEQVLFQCLASVASFSGTFSDQCEATHIGEDASVSKLAQLKSKLLFVGTYRDMVSQEEFLRKDKLLQERIRGTPFFEKGIIEFAAENQLMLAINNMSGGQGEIDMSRGILEKIIEKSFEEIEIPASWLVLSLQIRFKGVRTMSLGECERLAGKVGINPSELQHVLWFLHRRVGVLLYYSKLPALKGTVICDMQVVFDSTSNLVRNTFTFDKVGQYASEKFREKGQFSLKDVQDATSGHMDSLLPLKKLVQLLEYLSVLTVIPPPPSSGAKSFEEPTYFMPCVLRSARPSDLSVSLKVLDPAPLLLRFDCGYVPLGIFPSLITNLVSQTLASWKMLEEGLRKNRVQFLVGEDYNTVTLISHPRYLEIAISRKEDSQTPTESLCSHVRGIIQSTLSIITSRMNNHFSMGYKFGFKCPTHPRRDHLCILRKETFCRMECLQDEGLTIPLDGQQQVWFSAGAKGVPLSLNSLSLLKWKDKHGKEQTLRLVKKVSCKWLEFGLAVGVEMNCLEAWERQYHEDASRCWLEVMKCWLNAGGTPDYPTTWEGLCALLTDMECGSISTLLKEALLSFQTCL